MDELFRDGPPPPKPDTDAVATSPEVAMSVFDQMGVLAAAYEGPDYRLVAWNELVRGAFREAFPGLGESLLGSPWLRGTGFENKIVAVYETGEPFSASEWPLALPTSTGEIREAFYDIHYTPWRRSDGSVGGVLTTGVDVTEQVRRRQEAEARSQRWQAQFYASRQAMVVLQSALLPGRVPVVPGLHIGARYLVADSETAAGGDWFSALTLRDGRVALAVGDVVGHGVAASATMGRLRAVLEERLRATGGDIVAALDALDAFAADVPGADAATLCVATFDPICGVVEYCTAGHPPPLLVHGELWRYLEPTGHGPLRSGRGYGVTQEHVPTGDMVLLYTDGLVERPGRAFEQSTVEIGRVVTHALNGRPVVPDASLYSADRVCEQGLEQLTRETGYDDDITLLAAHRVPRSDGFESGTVAGQVSLVVADLDGWLIAIGAEEADRADMRHAVVELVTNSFEHAPAQPDQAVHVHLEAHLEPDGTLRVTVVDDGSWRRPDNPPITPGPDGDDGFRGLGLALVEQLTDEMIVQHDASGTTVVLRHKLTRPASIFDRAITSRPQPAPSLEEDLVTYSLPDRLDTVFVNGPLVAATTTQLRDIVGVESRGGTRDLVVDLNDLTHLASAGVQVLLQLTRVAEVNETVLTLIARPGTVAHHVLQLVGMPSSVPPDADTDDAPSTRTHD